MPFENNGAILKNIIIRIRYVYPICRNAKIYPYFFPYGRNVWR